MNKMNTKNNDGALALGVCKGDLLTMDGTSYGGGISTLLVSSYSEAKGVFYGRDQNDESACCKEELVRDGGVQNVRAGDVVGELALTVTKGAVKGF